MCDSVSIGVIIFVSRGPLALTFSTPDRGHQIFVRVTTREPNRPAVWFRDNVPVTVGIGQGRSRGLLGGVFKQALKGEHAIPSDAKGNHELDENLITYRKNKRGCQKESEKCPSVNFEKISKGRA